MMVDVHCHILPELDDGPKTMEEALRMCALAAEDGISTIVATPHMLNGIYNVKPSDIFSAVNRLNDSCRAAGLAVEIIPGADIYIDRDLPGLLADGQLMTIANRSGHIMLELPEESVPDHLDALLFDLQLAGVTPVISHPERNYAIQQDIHLLYKIVDGGNLTQITAGALTGQFGSTVQKVALQITKAGLAHLIASDAHDTQRRIPQLSRARKVVEQLLSPEQADLMTAGRARSIIDGKYVPIPEVEPPRKKGFFARFVKAPAVSGG
ncbi:MAG: tyrosine protein phosphatase [Actinobacteria bacterium]|nr:tyrosine protein phosphatase [Actinomycetota bacterium]